jgi:hypothetical protein
LGDRAIIGAKNLGIRAANERDNLIYQAKVLEAKLSPAMATPDGMPMRPMPEPPTQRPLIPVPDKQKPLMIENHSPEGTQGAGPQGKGTTQQSEPGTTGKPGATGGKPKWHNQTEDEMVQAYKSRYPNKGTLSEDAVRQAYQRGQRLNPETGRLVKPIQAIEPNGSRVLPEKGTPAHEDWVNYQNGDRSKLPCFPAGTVVQTPMGDRLIETLREGEIVFAYDLKSKSRVERPITATHQNWTQNIVVVKTEAGELASTRNHPYWVESSEEWLPASRLTEGMVLRSMDGKLRTINATEILLAEESTYNFEVDQQHNYFAGHSGILVHNGGGEGESSFLQTETYNTEIYEVRDQKTGKVVYVGKSTVGTEDRLLQHVNDPDSALHIPKDSPLRSNPNFPKNVYTSDPVADGNWTKYETAVQEQHFIEQNGGKTALRNKIDAITPEKFELYKNLHNPCM